MVGRSRLPFLTADQIANAASYAKDLQGLGEEIDGLGFGGGGHRLASGAKLDGPLAKAQNEMDAAVLAQLQVDLVAP